MDLEKLWGCTWKSLTVVFWGGGGEGIELVADIDVFIDLSAWF